MTESAAPLSGKLLWTPPDDAPVSSQVAAFAMFVKSRAGMDWNGGFPDVVALVGTRRHVTFWDLFWDWHGVVGEKGNRLIEKQHHATTCTLLSGCHTELCREHAGKC